MLSGEASGVTHCPACTVDKPISVLPVMTAGDCWAVLLIGSHVCWECVCSPFAKLSVMPKHVGACWFASGWVPASTILPTKHLSTCWFASGGCCPPPSKHLGACWLARIKCRPPPHCLPSILVLVGSDVTLLCTKHLSACNFASGTLPYHCCPSRCHKLVSGRWLYKMPRIPVLRGLQLQGASPYTPCISVLGGVQVYGASPYMA